MTPAAVGLQQALRSLSTQLSGAQVGITVTNLGIGFLAEPAFAELLRAPLTAPGSPTARSGRSRSPPGWRSAPCSPC